MEAIVDSRLSRRERSLPGCAGFTLIELLVVVGIVAILASVAYPSYTEYVLRSHRAAVQGVMTDLATRQHQFLLDTRAYGESAAALRSAVPTEVTARYDITIAAVQGPPPRFTISAVPKGHQAADACGTLSIDAAGAKLPSTCW